MQVVGDLKIDDEFIIRSTNTSMKEILGLISEDSERAILLESSTGRIQGIIDNEIIRAHENAGRKVQRGKAEAAMSTNLLRIIDKTPLARLPGMLPEKQPDGVIINDVAGNFMGFLSPNDFSQVVASLATDEPLPENDEIVPQVSDEFSPPVSSPPDSPPKPKRGPPRSRRKMEVETTPPEPETPAIIVEEITDDELEDETEAFFNRVRGRSTGAMRNIHGKLAEDAWGGAGEGAFETPTMMHPLGAGRAEGKPESDGMTQVMMKTSAGDILLQMYDDKSPETVANFLRLVDDGYYDGLHFHRVIEDFMLQGGCPHSRDPGSPRAGTGGPGWKIPCERSALSLSHDRPGLLSMANAGPNTGGSQFFLTTVPCSWLDGKHAVFGEVVSGMDTVRAIEGCAKGPGDRPQQPQQIISVSRA